MNSVDLHFITTGLTCLWEKKGKVCVGKLLRRQHIPGLCEGGGLWAVGQGHGAPAQGGVGVAEGGVEVSYRETSKSAPSYFKASWSSPGFDSCFVQLHPRIMLLRYQSSEYSVTTIC